MRSGRPVHGLLLAMLAVLVASCGSGDPEVPNPGPTDDLSVAIGIAGASMVVADPSGIRLEMDVPAGAILVPTTVRVRALAAPAGKVARFAIEPAGLDLLAPATFTVRLPEGMALDAALGLVFTNSEAVPVPADHDATARTLRFSGYSLGFGDLAGIPLPPTAPAVKADGEEFLDVEAIGCQFIAEALDLALLRARSFSGAFPPDLASPLITEYRLALLTCGADSLTDITAQVQEFACANAEGALLNAQVVLVETAADLRQIVGSLLAADGLIRAVDGDCAITTANYETELNEYLEAYLDRIDSPGFVTSFASWDELWGQITPCVELLMWAQQFGAEGVEAKVTSQLLPALFARLHDVATDACTSNEDNHYLLDLLSGGHDRGHPIGARELPQFSGLDADTVIDEVHRCASALVVETTTQAGELLDSVRIPAAAGTGDLLVTGDGRIRLGNDLQNFLCGGILDRPPVTVRAEVPGQLPAVQLGTLGSQLLVDVAGVAAQLPATAGAPSRQFDLVVERPRPVCGQGQAGAIELSRIHVSTRGFEGALAGVWSGCGSQSGTFQIAVAQDGTVSGTYGGTASGTITGQVTANGTLDAVASGGPCDWVGTLSLAGGTLSASGTWLCSAGCGGSFQSQ